MSSKISSIFVEELGSRGDISTHSCLSATIESLQFKIGRHEQVHELSISCCSCTAAVNIGSDIVDLLAVLFYHNRSSCGSGISTKHNTTIELNSHNSGSCLFVRKSFDDLLFNQSVVSEFINLFTFGQETNRSLPSEHRMLEDVPFQKLFKFYKLYILYDVSICEIIPPFVVLGRHNWHFNNSKWMSLFSLLCFEFGSWFCVLRINISHTNTLLQDRTIPPTGRFANFLPLAIKNGQILPDNTSPIKQEPNPLPILPGPTLILLNNLPKNILSNKLLPCIITLSLMNSPHKSGLEGSYLCWHLMTMEAKTCLNTERVTGA